MTVRGPTAPGVCDRQVDHAGRFFFLAPDTPRNFLAPQQVMLDTGEDAAPVEPAECFIDIAADLDSATGGFNKVLPVSRVLDREGNREFPEKDLQKAVDKILGRK